MEDNLNPESQGESKKEFIIIIQQNCSNSQINIGKESSNGRSDQDTKKNPRKGQIFRRVQFTYYVLGIVGSLIVITEFVVKIWH